MAFEKNCTCKVKSEKGKDGEPCGRGLKKIPYYKPDGTKLVRKKPVSLYKLKEVSSEQVGKLAVCLICPSCDGFDRWPRAR